MFSDFEQKCVCLVQSLPQETQQSYRRLCRGCQFAPTHDGHTPRSTHRASCDGWTLFVQQLLARCA